MVGVKKYRFVACEVSLQGEDGYMVLQMMDNKKVGSTFVSACGFDGFCKQIGVVPEICGTEVLAW